MKMSATVNSQLNQHQVSVQTNGGEKFISIAPKAGGYGSSVNGGELLLLALATCFCNDIYREAAKRNITVSHVHVTCNGEFGAEGEPGSNFTYTVQVEANATQAEITELISYTDNVAEVHNTLRKGIDVKLVKE